MASVAYCSRHTPLLVCHHAEKVFQGSRAEKMRKLMRAQDHCQWALPTHAALSSLAFKVVSPYLLTQESITRLSEGLVGIWPGSVGQDRRQRCGEKCKGER